MSDARARDRGFVMPLVVLLALVVGVMSALLLERISAQNRVVRRQVENYKLHHFERGVREVVGAWIVSLNGQPVTKMLDEDGRALDLDLTDGSTAVVYLFEAQGSVLSRPDGLTEQERVDGAAVVQELWRISGGEPPADWFRPVGPLAVSARTAPEEILLAIGRVAGGERAGQGFARELIRTREVSPELTEADLAGALQAAGIEGAARERALRLVRPKSDLWHAVIDVYGPRGAQPIARFGGRFTMPGEYNTKNLGTFQSLGAFLTWEELPLEPGK
jgi:hypothetical protein